MDLSDYHRDMNEIARIDAAELSEIARIDAGELLDSNDSAE